MSGLLRRTVRVGAGVTAAGALGLGYAVGIERQWFTLRRTRLEVLDPVTAAGRTLRVLHLSDLHLRPGQRLEQRFVEGLAALEPDLVVDTGDNLSHTRAVPAVLRALGGLLDRPGLVVWGSNDYHGPKPKNPSHYLFRPQHRVLGPELPWRDLRAAMLEHGWQDATHARHTLIVNGVRIAAAGVDDPHIGRDDYDRIAGPADEPCDLRLGLTHSPEPRVLDAFAADGYDLVLAGHTHGGQLRVPGYGAIVTNCGLDRSRARGASRWGEHMRLHVSAGLGTSPYAPARFSCRPEATLLELVPRASGPGAAVASPAAREGHPPSARSGADR
ncbi:metallophosphoesterase [Actinomycetospora lutea]|uniref:metallophosphoesterase n=1 Tax=Actinomycetospora lutea TaxID=663604 RepID=UPI0023670F35|nr:metallophosphoesterase [Actinomycetospora lutea]MDD7941741.1 metallophosphoesterase [Actinomycetospora lutea]